jgi:hypothetical protein
MLAAADLVLHVVGWCAELGLNPPEVGVHIIDVLALCQVVVLVWRIYVWQWGRRLLCWL